METSIPEAVTPDQGTTADVNQKGSSPSSRPSSQDNRSVRDRMREDLAGKRTGRDSAKKPKAGQPADSGKATRTASTGVKQTATPPDAQDNDQAAPDADKSQENKTPETIPYHAFKEAKEQAAKRFDKLKSDSRKEIAGLTARAEKAEMSLQLALARIQEISPLANLDAKDVRIKELEYNTQLKEFESQLSAKVQKELDERYAKQDEEATDAEVVSALVNEAKAASAKIGGKISAAQIIALQRASPKPISADEVVKQFFAQTPAAAPKLPKVATSGAVPSSSPRSGNVRTDMANYLKSKKGKN